MQVYNIKIAREVTVQEGFQRYVRASSPEKAAEYAQQLIDNANADCPDDCRDFSSESGLFDQHGLIVQVEAELIPTLERADAILSPADFGDEEDEAEPAPEPVPADLRITTQAAFVLSETLDLDRWYAGFGAKMDVPTALELLAAATFRPMTEAEYSGLAGAEPGTDIAHIGLDDIEVTLLRNPPGGAYEPWSFMVANDRLTRQFDLTREGRIETVV